MGVPVVTLGQCGFRLLFGETVIYTDPYLTDHVAEIEGEEMRRQVPVLIEPEHVTDADYVLVTHAHIDHCDIQTLLPISQASVDCLFVAPNEVTSILSEGGIDKGRMIVAGEDWIELNPSLRIMPVPAAHPTVEVDQQGYYRCVGYVIDYEGRRFYHAGDGSPDDLVFERLDKLSPIDVAFIPVNERNYMRDKRGIIGNMSLREAYYMADKIGVKTLVPTHWDMFAPNSAYIQEIELLHKLMGLSFKLNINPSEI